MYLCVASVQGHHAIVELLEAQYKVIHYIPYHQELIILTLLLTLDIT